MIGVPVNGNDPELRGRVFRPPKPESHGDRSAGLRWTLIGVGGSRRREPPRPPPLPLTLTFCSVAAAGLLVGGSTLHGSGASPAESLDEEDAYQPQVRIMWKNKQDHWPNCGLTLGQHGPVLSHNRVNVVCAVYGTSHLKCLPHWTYLYLHNTWQYALLCYHMLQGQSRYIQETARNPDSSRFIHVNRRTLS